MCLFLFRSFFKECFWWVNAKQTKLSQSGGCNSLAYSVSAKIKWKNGLKRMDSVIFSDLLCKELSLCSVAGCENMISCSVCFLLWKYFCIFERCFSAWASACLSLTQIQEVLFFQTTNCYCVNCHRVCDTVTPLCHSF